MMIMSAMLAQTSWNPTQFTTDIQLRDRRNLDVIMARIFENIRARREAYSFLKPDNSEVDLGKIFPVELFNDKVYSAVASNNVDEALRQVYLQVQNLLGQHEILIGAIQSQLVEKRVITASEIKTLVERYMTARAHRDLRKAILAAEPGALNLDRHPMFFSRQRLTLVQRLNGYLRRLFMRGRPFSPPTPLKPKHYVRCLSLLTGMK